MELMNARQTAAYLHMSYSHFMLLKQKDPTLVPPFIRIGSKIDRWDREAVDTWLKQNQANPSQRN